jgi:cytidyltransferase-like protein
MIVAWHALPTLAGQVVMVDGSFDPLHEGHVAYFEAAAAIGKPVLCNITSDEWTLRKHPVLLARESRTKVIDAIRFVTYVHSAVGSTRDVLAHLRPYAYVKGSDWLEKGGVPTEESDLCKRLGIEVRYVDTVLNSSTRLIERIRGS